MATDPWMTDPQALAATIREGANFFLSHRMTERPHEADPSITVAEHVADGCPACKAEAALADMVARLERTETALRLAIEQDYCTLCGSILAGEQPASITPDIPHGKPVGKPVGMSDAQHAATLDVSYRERRLAEKMRDPEFRKAYEAAQPAAPKIGTNAGQFPGPGLIGVEQSLRQASEPLNPEHYDKQIGDAQPAATDDYRAYMEQKADLGPGRSNHP